MGHSRSLEILQNYVDYWNDSDRNLFTKLNPDVMGEHFAGIVDIFTEPPRSHIGVSSLGKPMPLLALKKFGYNEPIINRLRITFFTGHLMEMMIFKTMKSHNLPLHSEQAEVYFNGFLGHIDGCLGDILLEVKTMSSGYWQQFTNKPNNMRGYISQLAVYRDFMDMPAYWLCFNKETSELAIVPFPDEELDASIDEVTEKINKLESIETVNDLGDCWLPSPPAEMYRKQATGKFLVPQNMKLSHYYPAFYDIEKGENGYGKPQQYVTRIKTTEEINDWLQLHGIK